MSKSAESKYNSEWRSRLLRDNLRNIEALVESGTPLTPGQVEIVKKSVDSEEKAASLREEEEPDGRLIVLLEELRPLLYDPEARWLEDVADAAED